MSFIYPEISLVQHLSQINEHLGNCILCQHFYFKASSLVPLISFWVNTVYLFLYTTASPEPAVSGRLLVSLGSRQLL